MREKLYVIKIRIFSHCHKTQKLVLRHLRWFMLMYMVFSWLGSYCWGNPTLEAFARNLGSFDDVMMVRLMLLTLMMAFLLWPNFQRWSCYWCTMIHSMGGVKKWQSISTHFVFWGESATCILSFLSLFLASLHGNSSSRFYLLSR